MPTTAERTEELLTLIDTTSANLFVANDLATAALLRNDFTRYNETSARIREIAARLARHAQELAEIA